MLPSFHGPTGGNILKAEEKVIFNMFGEDCMELRMVLP